MYPSGSVEAGSGARLVAGCSDDLVSGTFVEGRLVRPLLLGGEIEFRLGLLEREVGNLGVIDLPDARNLGVAIDDLRAILRTVVHSLAEIRSGVDADLRRGRLRGGATF